MYIPIFPSHHDFDTELQGVRAAPSSRLATSCHQRPILHPHQQIELSAAVGAEWSAFDCARADLSAGLIYAGLQLFI